MTPTACAQRPAVFTYAYFRSMLETAISAGYVVTSFVDYDVAASKTIILRHDIDYTLDGALRLAEIEASLGCTATFLFRIHADEYNLFSCVAWDTMRRIKRLGHEIGLHFEAMNVGRALGLDPVALLKQEKQVIEAILGFPVLTASEHREISGTVHGTPTYRSLYDPYEAGFRFYGMDPRYCRDMKYLSDSNANWREGDLFQHLGAHDRFQILVHPDWWFDGDLLLKGPYHHPRSVDE